jgi:hypothetical protein
MTPFTRFQPGAELPCSACEFRCAGRFDEPACQIAMEIALDGEPMSASCCPETKTAAA